MTDSRFRQLSGKQREIYDYIRRYIRERSYPPSVREIAAAVQLKSPSTVHFHLRAMEAQGVLTRGAGKTRSIALVEPEEPTPDRVPLLDGVTAGAPIPAGQFVEDCLLFDTGGRSGEHFALRVREDAMKNAGILPGDFLIVHRCNTAEDGAIVVALLGEETACRRVRWAEPKAEESGLRKLWLMPEHEGYAPVDGAQARIIGQVVGVLRKYV